MLHIVIQSKSAPREKQDVHLNMKRKTRRCRGKRWTRYTHRGLVVHLSQLARLRSDCKFIPLLVSSLSPS